MEQVTSVPFWMTSTEKNYKAFEIPMLISLSVLVSSN